MGSRVVAFVGALLVVAGCSSPGITTTMSCRFSLGTQSSSFVLDSASTGRTPLGVGQLTGTVAREAGVIRLSVFGPSPADHFVMGSDGGATKFKAQVADGYLLGTCR